MARNTEIIFSARDNGVESTISRIKSSANQLGRDLIKEAQANTSNAKEAIKYYEDQIKLIERRNRVEAESAKLSATKARDRGLEAAGADPQARKDVQGQFKRTMAGISTGSKEDKIQIELLREILISLKSESQKEDRRSQQEQNAERRGIGVVGGVAGDRGRGGTRRGAAGDDRGGSVGGGLGAAGNAGVDVLQQQSGMGAVGSALGAIGRRVPVVAAAYGMWKGATALWDAESRQEQSLRELAGLSGGSVNQLMGMNVGDGRAARYNVDREEFRSSIAPATARAYGTTQGLLGAGGRAISGIEIQKGMGVSGDIVHALEKMTRVVTNSGSAQNQAQHLFRRLDEEGAFGAAGADMSRMQDIMQSFVQLQSGMFMRHGEMSSSSMVLDLLGRFEALGGAYKDDQYKASTIQSLDRGLAQAGSPEVQAIKMGILRQLNPEMGFFDLQTEMEKGVQSKGYLQNVMKFVRNTGGGLNEQKILFDQLTGGQMRGADVSRMLESGEFDKASLGMGTIMGSDRTFDFAGRARAASSEVTTRQQLMDETWTDIKVELFQKLDEWIEKLGDKLTNFF